MFSFSLFLKTRHINEKSLFYEFVMPWLNKNLGELIKGSFQDWMCVFVCVSVLCVLLGMECSTSGRPSQTPALSFAPSPGSVSLASVVENASTDRDRCLWVGCVRKPHTPLLRRLHRIVLENRSSSIKNMVYQILHISVEPLDFAWFLFISKSPGRSPLEVE